MMHTVIVRNRRITVVSGGAVADNYGADVVDLRLDSAFDGCEAVLILGCGDSAVRQIWAGDPLPVPGSLMVEGDIPVSVAGFRDGVRIVTAAGASIHVERAGCYDGSDPAPDDPDMLQQLVQAAGDARSAAGAATEAAQTATDAAKVAADSAASADAAVESATKAAQSATSAAKQASDAADRADKLSEDIPGYVTAAKQSATDADGSATAAEKSASSAAGSATQAADSAEAAQGSATAASTSATAAADSATTATDAASLATSKATQAANSAAQVADKYITSATATTLEPGSEATAQVTDQVLTLGIPRGDKGDKGDPGVGVPDGGEPGQLLSKTDGGTAWVDPPSGNVLVGTASGNVAHAEDAFAEKPREIRIKGKTRQNLCVNPSGTANGVTATPIDDGSLTLSGTINGATTIYSTNIYTLKPNAIYTVSVNKALSDSADISFAIIASGGILGNGSNVHFGYTGNLSSTFTVKEGASNIRLAVYCASTASGTTVSGTYRIMLNEGTELEPWCPPGVHGVEPEKLVVAGKNLIKPRGFESETTNGVTATRQADGGYKLDGTASDSAFIGVNYSASSSTFGQGFLPGVTVTASCDLPSGVNFTFGCREQFNGESIGGSLGTVTSTNGQVTATTQKNARVLFCYLVVISGTTLDNVTVYPQLELGSTATAYEPPMVTEVALPEMDALMDGDELTVAQDGSASVSRADGTTDQLGSIQTQQLPAPTFNVYPIGGYVPGETDAEYERDVNIAYEQLEAKISALNVAQATS